MLFQNIELYNVSELEELGRDGAYKMLRIPRSVQQQLDTEQGKNMAYANTGVELRFNMISDSVKIKLCANDPNRILRQLVYYGPIGAGWQDCVKYVTGSPTEITIQKPTNKEQYEAAAKALGSEFDPMLVRVLMLNAPCSIISVEGKVEPPRKEQTPKKKYLAYGSSITHGSLALNQNETYAFRVADSLGYDLINLGFAGSAYIEGAMADHIASRNDWDTATLEMGINVLSSMELEEYRKRVKYFISTVAGAHPDKKVFCIDLFYCGAEFNGNTRPEQMREIMRDTVEELALPNAVYLNGKTLLTGIHGLSGDMVHPNVYGAEEIARNLSAAMKKHLN